MREMLIGEMEEILKQRKEEEPLVLRGLLFQNLDFSRKDLHNIDFGDCMFLHVRFDGANMAGTSVRNACLDGCSLQNVDFTNAELCLACMRGANMSGCNISGANLYGAILENANLTNIKDDENTKWFRMCCPETGPMVGYKKCCEERIVQLLIPAEAKRNSATIPGCRCDKAKVLSIKNLDETEEYDEAYSLVDDNFVYRRGEWVKVENFNEDRWFISTTGIHFCLTREDAVKF